MINGDKNTYVVDRNIPSDLGGEQDSNKWDFVAPHGPLPNPVGHTFPVLTHDVNGQWSLIGTGFYISTGGLFVTARHVITEVLDGDSQVKPLAILHLMSETGLFGPTVHIMRPISQCWIGDKVDIALGVAASAINNVSGESLSHWRWPLSWSVPTKGMQAATYAFPNHLIRQADNKQSFIFRPDLYNGHIEELHDYRDQKMPHPCMQINFRIHGAASGGPVVGEDGFVIGINCTEWVPDGPGFVAQICCLQDAFIEDAALCKNKPPGKVTFRELISAGATVVRDYVPYTRNSYPGHVIRLDNVPVIAQAPSLDIIISS